MIEFMALGAWVLTLVVVGIIVISTGLPELDYPGDDGPLIIWICKLIYLVAIAVTFYEMGVHFSSI